MNFVTVIFTKKKSGKALYSTAQGGEQLCHVPVTETSSTVDL